MDPERGGIVQKMITGMFYAILSVAYFIMKIVLRNKKETIVEPKHLHEPPSVPVPSLSLANALNPKTPVEKLLELVIDSNPYVRRAVCRNPSLPVGDLEKLTHDRETMVAAEDRKSTRLNSSHSSISYAVFFL